ncbi:hypothetical protein [uncultured Dubosiella sp.]|uniref:hypothetical protein n=1 Tax=uncultured Dubosiella sp. TaxID=1937011 RepID=UPI00258D23F8|nr:hypothetical protein [uncultured Dubosiella sp.]
MKNENASNGIAEEMIRTFVQLGCCELHVKTTIEKKVSELENGMVPEDNVQDFMKDIEDLRKDLIEYAQLRRETMLSLYEMYPAGNKEYWCLVKHLGLAMYTAFESWQASDDDENLFYIYQQANKLFVKAMSKFLGVTITECASCFSDILKAESEVKNDGSTSDLRETTNKDSD